MPAREGRGPGPQLQVTVDCHDPAVLVRFWAAALAYDVEPPPGGHPTWVAYWRSIGVPEEELGPDDDPHDSIVDPAGIRPRIWFQAVPEPKTGKNRLHLDLMVSGGREVAVAVRRKRVEEEVARLVGLGASRLRTLGHDGMDYYAVVLADPEGNEFCVA